MHAESIKPKQADCLLNVFLNAFLLTKTSTNRKKWEGSALFKPCPLPHYENLFSKMAQNKAILLCDILKSFIFCKLLLIN